jgi:phosphoribosylanthranilate isomerase
VSGEAHPHPHRASRLEVKICGLTRVEDARAAAEAGADRVGAVLVPGTPRAVTPARAGELGRAAGLPLTLVVAGLAPEAAAAAAREAGARALQLHGGEAEETFAALRDRGDWELWKAARVRSGEEILAAARRWVGVADLLLLDGWHPGQLGGTGTRFPWEALEEARSLWPRGLRLGAAGGLTPRNVAEAVRRLAPDLVDVSSGVEASPGRKDPDALRAFVAAARDAARGSAPGSAPGSPAEPGPGAGAAPGGALGAAHS